MKPRSPLSSEEKEKAKILHASGKSIYAVSRSLNRSPHTLAKFLRKPETAKEVGIQREELAAMFDVITHKTLSGVTDEDIKKSSLLQKMTAAGISIDKALLLRNLPTAIIGSVQVLMNLAEMLRSERDVEDEAAAERWREQHTLTVPPVVPAPEPEPPARSPQPRTQTQHPPTPRVTYQSAKEVEPDSADYDPLGHGLYRP
jgi:hypothetical protein